MKKKIKVKNVSAWGIGITLALAFLFALLSIQAEKEFQELKVATDQYISCENAAKQLQDGADYLTEQVRLYAMTGEKEYMEQYFEEVDVTKRREQALEDLRQYFADTEVMRLLQNAMDSSQKLMDTEYESMKLVAEASGLTEEEQPQQIQKIELPAEDEQLSDSEKIEKARQIVCSSEYQDARTTMTNDVTECMNQLIEKTQKRQGRADRIFSDMYLKLEIGIVVLAVLLFTICIIVRRLLVIPLIQYNESIGHGKTFQVTGAAELQNLALIYNQVFEENQEVQKLLRHQAEHDALTDVMNRGVFEKLLHIYEEDTTPFALALIDIDIFKEVNDRYGHSVGDEVLKKTARLLKQMFRKADHICRIGGDEFAVLMPGVCKERKKIIQEKIKNVNIELAKASGEVPAVSLSVGVAFSDRENQTEEIFRNADEALYEVKKRGRNGCEFYESQIRTITISQQQDRKGKTKNR